MEQPATAGRPACWYWTGIPTAGFTFGGGAALIQDSLLIQSEFPPCPGAAPAPAGYYAASFWYVTPLPSPAPDAPPGYGITGKLLYLLAGDSNAFTHAYNTPRGRLVLDVKGTYTVDWGDGSAITGPYETPGRPWPTGTITHTYDDVGSYTITVRETWTATWTLAGQGGTLGGVRTTGTIPAFHVRQIQAVVTG